MDKVKYYVLLDAEKRICMITVKKQNEEQFEFEFPSNFDFNDIINWKIINNELVYDKLPIPEDEPQMSLEDRIADLEIAICELVDSME